MSRADEHTNNTGEITPLELATVEDQQQKRSYVQTFAIVSSLYVALFISAVNTTIITTALPTIADHFHPASGYTMTLGFGLLVDLKPSTCLEKIIIYQCIGALGSGLLIQPPLIAIQANVSQNDTATPTSTLNFIRGLAQAVAIVIGGVVFQSSVNQKKPELHDAGLPQDLVNFFSGEDAQANVGKLRSLSNHGYQHIVQRAYAGSLQNVWILCTAAAALPIVAAYFVGTHSLAANHVETRTGLRDRDDKRK